MTFKKKNKKGNVFFGVGLGLFLFVTGVLILPFLTDDITTARANLGCELPATISSGTMFVCLGISGIAPYFIWFFLSLAIGFILGSND